MSEYPHDRRQIYDLDYFINGGIERRKGSWHHRRSLERLGKREQDARITRKYDFRIIRSVYNSNCNN